MPVFESGDTPPITVSAPIAAEPVGQGAPFTVRFRPAATGKAVPPLPMTGSRILRALVAVRSRSAENAATTEDGMAFHGKVALVTGAASGMGRLAARRLASGGAAVAALDVNEAGLRETRGADEHIRTYAVDVTDARAVAETVRRIESELGPLDRVTNAAAIMPTDRLLDQDPELVNRIMAINYGGTVNVTYAALPGMLERRRGDLINFASVAGWMPSLHFGAYNASKFAVVAFTEVLQHENRASGVRFACVCPPPVATPLLDQAKSQPKILTQLPPIRPETVLDAIERDLERDRLMVYPDRNAAVAVWMRRHLPRLLWWNIHRVEGF